MLINSFMESYRELTGQAFESRNVVTMPTARTAANADRFEKTGKLARRQRRMRRLERAGQHKISGWTVRAW